MAGEGVVGCYKGFCLGKSVTKWGCGGLNKREGVCKSSRRVEFWGEI